MSRKRPLSSTMSRAKKLRKYMPFVKSKPEPELIDMSIWRIGGPRGFRSDFSTRSSEDCENANADEIVDRDWVLVSRDGLIVPDDWEEVSNDDYEGQSPVRGERDPEDEDLAEEDSSVDISSGESDDVPCVIPNFAARCHPRIESNSSLLQQGQDGRERFCWRQRLDGEEYELEGTGVLDDSRISEQWTSAYLAERTDEEDAAALILDVDRERWSATTSSLLCVRPPDQS